MANVKLVSEFKASDVVFGAKKTTKEGRTFVPVTLANGREPVLQLPLLRVAFDPDVSPPDAKNDPSKVTGWSLSLDLRGAESKPEVAQLIAVLRELDAGVHGYLASNAKDLGSKTYTNMLKEDESGKYPPSMRVKIRMDYKTHEPDVILFDRQSQEQDRTQLTECLKRDCEIIAIVGLSPLWLIGKQAYMSFRASQIMVLSSPAPAKQPQFRLPEGGLPPPPPAAAPAAMDEDEDNEAPDEDESAEF